jgi:hypothetical protein
MDFRIPPPHYFMKQQRNTPRWRVLIEEVPSSQTHKYHKSWYQKTHTKEIEREIPCKKDTVWKFTCLSSGSGQRNKAIKYSLECPEL